MTRETATDFAISCVRAARIWRNARDMEKAGFADRRNMVIKCEPVVQGHPQGFNFVTDLNGGASNVDRSVWR